MAHFSSFVAVLALALVPGSLHAGGSDANFLTALGEGHRQKIVVYGTSLTANSAWPADLQDTLRAASGRKCKVVNAARGGMDSRWGLANFETRVIREEPDSVFIEFAINDALEQSKLSVDESMWNLEQMVGMVRHERPVCEVILLVMNPPTGSPLAQRSRIKDYENGYRRVARRNSCRIIDFSTVWRPIVTRQPERWEAYAPDGLHPNKKACREVILPRLLKEIGFQLPAGNPLAGR